MVQFISELVTRLFSKSPWFFKVIKWIAAIVAIFSAGLPELVKVGVIGADSGIYTAITSAITFTAAVTALIMAQFPVSSTSPAASEVKK